jgi:hypothetical protein
MNTPVRGTVYNPVNELVDAQRRGELVALVDLEGAADLLQYRALGIDCARMLLSQPASHAQALDVVEALIRSCQLGAVLVTYSKGFDAKLKGEQGARIMALLESVVDVRPCRLLVGKRGPRARHGSDSATSYAQIAL